MGWDATRLDEMKILCNLDTGWMFSTSESVYV